ncbi:MAG: DUF342 domain-containing protein [Syntrophomonadaceae bacterium]|mgnify:FL=1|nr:DUF342 domain-containing protein [Syntrophomonadaceae bacterium]
MSANFRIIETFDGYYLKVTGKVDLNLLSQEIKRHNLDVDVSKIMREVVNAKVGQEILLQLKPEESTDGKIIITVGPGKMSALLTLNIRPGEKVPLDEVYQKLKDKQVVHGVNLERIKTLINLKRPAFREVIATGNPPEPGLDASITYVYNQPELDPAPVEDGFAYEPGYIIQVREGDVIAQRTPSTLGVFGCNVMGEIVHPLPGRNLEFKVGNSVIVKGNTALAGRDGALTWEESVLHITDLNTIAGDLEMGAISAKGMVLVMGNVGPGTHIQAQDDVEIRGTLEGGTVISVNGSVFVKGGIAGQSQVKAGGNIEAPFIEESTVAAGRNLVIDDFIFDSSLSVGKAVYFKTIKEYKPANQQKKHLDPQKTQGRDEPAAHGPVNPARMKQISQTIKSLEREIKTFISQFKGLTGKEEFRQELREQLSRYSKRVNSLHHLRQERQDLINKCGGRGLGIMGLLANVGVEFHIRYEEFLLEQPVTNATAFYNHLRNQVIFIGDEGEL